MQASTENTENTLGSVSPRPALQLPLSARKIFDQGFPLSGNRKRDNHILQDFLVAMGVLVCKKVRPAAPTSAGGFWFHAAKFVI